LGLAAPVDGAVAAAETEAALSGLGPELTARVSGEVIDGAGR
jgi:hypothetical protein